MASMNTRAELSVAGDTPEPVHIPPSDGYVLSRLLWQPLPGSCPLPLMVSNPATSVVWPQTGELTAGMARAAPFRIAAPRNPQTRESFHASEQSFSR